MSHHVRTAIAAASLALAAAACGGASDATDTLAPADAVRAAVSTTTQQPSSRMSMTIHTDAGAMKIDMTMEGLFDYAKKTGTMSMTVPGTDQKVEGVLTPETMYMKVPGKDGWYALPTRELGG